MLFVTLSQHWIFLVILWYGLLFGTLYKLGQIVCKSIIKKFKNTKHLTNSNIVKKSQITVKNSKKHRKTHKKADFFSDFIKFLLDFVISLLAGIVYIAINYNYNFGEIRIYTILGFVLGVILGAGIVNIIKSWITKFCYRKHIKSNTI